MKSHIAVQMYQRAVMEWYLRGLVIAEGDLRVAIHGILHLFWYRESGEDGGAAEGGGGLAAAFIAMADVDCEGLGERRFEGYRSTFFMGLG
jgi:hypothetical protein